MITAFLNSLENLLNENLYFDNSSKYIVNKDNKPIFSFDLYDNEIRLESNISRKAKWKYIKAGYKATENTNLKFSPTQIKGYLNYYPPADFSFNNDVLNMFYELDDFFTYLDKYHDFGLKSDPTGPNVLLHLSNPCTTIKLNWSVNEKNWELKASSINHSASLTKLIKRGELVSQLIPFLEHFINSKEVQYIFSKEPYLFSQQFPLLSNYFQRRLMVSQMEYQKLAECINYHTGITPLSLELELLHSRKSNKIQSLIFSNVKVGGENVFCFKKQIASHPDPEIFFKIR